MPSSHLILCCFLLLLPPVLPSIRVFSNESTLRMRWPKYWNFSLSISPSNEYSGLISFRMDWLDLLAVQGTLKSLLQHHSSKATILQHMYTHTYTNMYIYLCLGFSVICYGEKESYIHMYLYFYSSSPVFVSKYCTSVCYSS